jgi:hypothetical protein
VLHVNVITWQGDTRLPHEVDAAEGRLVMCRQVSNR